MADEILSQKYLNTLFEYRDGNLYWKKIHPCNKRMLGEIAGRFNYQKGYVYIKINRKLYLAHRLIFLIHKGYLPKIVDHIDRCPTNNKIENLREATLSQNNSNSKIRKDNSSGVKGVNFHKVTKKWQVRIWMDKKVVFYGLFDCLEKAREAANEARLRIHGKFANC